MLKKLHTLTSFKSSFYYSVSHILYPDTKTFEDLFQLDYVTLSDFTLYSILNSFYSRRTNLLNSILPNLISFVNNFDKEFSIYSNISNTLNNLNIHTLPTIHKLFLAETIFLYLRDINTLDYKFIDFNTYYILHSTKEIEALYNLNSLGINLFQLLQAIYTYCPIYYPSDNNKVIGFRKEHILKIARLLFSIQSPNIYFTPLLSLPYISQHTNYDLYSPNELDFYSPHYLNKLINRRQYSHKSTTYITIPTTIYPIISSSFLINNPHSNSYDFFYSLLSTPHISTSTIDFINLRYYQLYHTPLNTSTSFISHSLPSSPSQPTYTKSPTKSTPISSFLNIDLIDNHSQ